MRVGRWVGGSLTAAALGAVAALAIGATVPASSGPIGADAAMPHTHVNSDNMSDMPGMSHAGATVPVGGTSASAGGFSLVPLETTFTPGRSQDFRFQIQGADGKPVTSFASVHDKLVHLILARHDLTGFQHVHPSMAADGTWSIRLTFAEPGSYRAYADFTAIEANGTRAAAVLGTDLTVTGPTTAVPLPAPTEQSTVDGFMVAYRGAPTVGVVEPMLFTITRHGAPVDLQRYLDAFGHLVVLRSTDLGYLHIHPETDLVDGAIKFWAAVPSAGTYRMYLDFQVEGTVHTAEFTLAIP